MNQDITAHSKRLESKIFQALDQKNLGYLTKQELIKKFLSVGVLGKNPRVKGLFTRLSTFSDTQKINKIDFHSVIQEDIDYISQVLQGDLIIPDFKEFCGELTDIFERTRENKSGKVADYIPQLGRVDPEKFALSVCTIDGQQFHLGDSKENFCVQSSSKPFSYCMALEEFGSDYVHKHVGREPSGKGFNELTLNEKGLPHNPMINSGAIMACSMIKPQLNLADRFDYILDTWRRLAGNSYVGFNNSVYLSERQTADRNFALGYFMRENAAFPENTNLLEILEFYFQCCSVELNAKAMASIAATLANGGINPLTQDEVFKPSTVKNCLSLMGSCGMYDFSGEFSFKIGLPAKSGVSGVIILVIPNVMGISIWSPRLDKLGNSVRGIQFCEELVKKYNFHNYDSLVSKRQSKKDPRKKSNHEHDSKAIEMCWAAARGDIHSIQHMVARGYNIQDADYDGRTPLHLAAAEGHMELVEYLYNKGGDIAHKDRWGRSAIDDAKQGGHKKVEEFISKKIKTPMTGALRKGKALVEKQDQLVT